MRKIIESGMTFGPFEEDTIYQIESSRAYKTLGECVKSVEFVYKRSQKRIWFVEAKKSSPVPWNESDFSEYINDIADKFLHSFELWMTLNLMRRTDTLPRDMIGVAMDKLEIVFVLVINGHKLEWLSPIADALERKMIALVRIWDFKISVLNEKAASKYGLVK